VSRYSGITSRLRGFGARSRWLWKMPRQQNENSVDTRPEPAPARRSPVDWLEGVARSGFGSIAGPARRSVVCACTACLARHADRDRRHRGRPTEIGGGTRRSADASSSCLCRKMCAIGGAAVRWPRQHRQTALLPPQAQSIVNSGIVDQLPLIGAIAGAVGRLT
jgi:hypothetical protein